MKEKDLAKQLRELKNIRPQEEWAVSAREDLLNHIEKTEVSNNKYPISNIGHWLRQLRWTLAAALGVAVLMIASVVGAQYTAPGSPLYPVKIASEKVRGFVAADDASFKASLIERRVQEATELVSSTVSKDEADQVAQSLAGYSEDARQAEESGNEAAVNEVANDVTEVMTVLQSNYEAEGGTIEEQLHARVENKISSCSNEELRDEVNELLKQDDLSGLFEAFRLASGCERELDEDNENEGTATSSTTSTDK